MKPEMNEIYHMQFRNKYLHLVQLNQSKARRNNDNVLAGRLSKNKYLHSFSKGRRNNHNIFAGILLCIGIVV